MFFTSSCRNSAFRRCRFSSISSVKRSKKPNDDAIDNTMRPAKKAGLEKEMNQERLEITFIVFVVQARILTGLPPVKSR